MDSAPLVTRTRFRPWSADKSARALAGARWWPPGATRTPQGTIVRPLRLFAPGSHRFRAAQLSKRLVALRGEEETFEVATASPALGASAKRDRRRFGILLERAGSGVYGQGFAIALSPPRCQY